jgi:prepilin-type N-terminal cleavage/methylation domain-containing protein
MNKLGAKGFTMLEMLTVIAVIGIVSFFALSTMHDYLERTKLRNTVETVAADIRQARWIARSRSATCTIVFDAEARSYLVSGAQHAMLPEGIRFGVDPTVSGKPSDPSTAPPEDGISFDSGGKKNQTRFYPTGSVSPTGSVYITDGKETMAITVAITGRPKIWKSCGGRKWISM